jgi:hypothetical protein
MNDIGFVLLSLIPGIVTVLCLFINYRNGEKMLWDITDGVVADKLIVVDEISIKGSFSSPAIEYPVIQGHHHSEKQPCRFCGSIFTADQRGNCGCCGAPK